MRSGPKPKTSTSGIRLRQRREELGLSVTELAERAGVTAWSLRQIEYGQTKSIAMPSGLVIANALGVSPWWLAGLKEPSGRAKQQSA
jgi:transcriptional regulator with XRE-family HTH domain